MSRTIYVPLKIFCGAEVSAGTPFLSFTEYLPHPRVLLPPLAPEFCVITGGRDTNPGTLAAPVRTIRHAAALAQPADVITVTR